ncbi:MAG: zinc-binding dehydrogenase [Actinomycetes bacterium]
MRALAITDRESKPSVQDVPAGTPGPGQVQVTVEAASINGIDAFAAAGYLWDAMPHTFPVVLGRDFAGTVGAVGAVGAVPVVGAGSDAWAVGDRVLGVVTALELGSGAIAESVTVDAQSLVAVPDAVSAVQAAAVGLAGATAAALVQAIDPTKEDVVLVSGSTGGVGALAVQLVAATGARVLATARPGAGSDFVRALGADEVVDHTGDLTSAVRAAAPDGVDAVLHLAGDATVLGALLRPGGRFASTLGATAEQTGRDDITVTPVMADSSAPTLRHLLDSVADGTLSVPVHRTYPLAESADAIADFGAPKLGKLVVTNP